MSGFLLSTVKYFISFGLWKEINQPKRVIGWDSNAVINNIDPPDNVEFSKCPICFEQISDHNFVMLDCGHILCTTCFCTYTAKKIMEGMIDGLVCPVIDKIPYQKCNAPIPKLLLTAHLSPALQKRLHHLLIQSYCEAEQSCPKCTNWYLGFSDTKQNESLWAKITCTNCNHRFCGKCGKEPHRNEKHLHMTCEQYAKLSDEQVLDAKFFEYVEEKRIFPCPRCRMYGEKWDGCNCLYCRCGATFCALCGAPLTGEGSHCCDGGRSQRRIGGLRR